jgi:uncharacterized protein (TIGR00369 family)
VGSACAGELGPGTLAPAAPKRERHWRQLESSYGDSPIHQTFGLTLTVTGAGEVVIRAEATKAAANKMGTVAGGLLAQMVDSAAVQAVRSSLGTRDRAVTVELNVNFLRPARPGGPLRAGGSLLDMSRTLAVATAEVRDAEDALVAVGRVTVRLLRSAGTESTEAATPGSG